jgi:predicted amidohydrolase YtcJ
VENWNHQIWDNPILPTKEWIDEFTNDIPVFLTRMDYHMALANSKALELAGIDNNAKNPDGGIIVKDTLTGEPTGILKDKAMELVSKCYSGTE